MGALQQGLNEEFTRLLPLPQEALPGRGNVQASLASQQIPAQVTQ